MIPAAGLLGPAGQHDANGGWRYSRRITPSAGSASAATTSCTGRSSIAAATSPQRRCPICSSVTCGHSSGRPFTASHTGPQRSQTSAPGSVVPSFSLASQAHDCLFTPGRGRTLRGGPVAGLRPPSPVAAGAGPQPGRIPAGFRARQPVMVLRLPSAGPARTARGWGPGEAGYAHPANRQWPLIIAIGSPRIGNPRGRRPYVSYVRRGNERPEWKRQLPARRCSAHAQPPRALPSPPEPIRPRRALR